MGKRKVVPAALHSELSEYASLIRVLRTNSTLDVASQLTRQHTPLSSTPNRSHQHPSPTSPSVAPTEATSISKGKGRASTTNNESPKTRDTWTRWPLLAEEVHVPEWDFQEEIRLLAHQSLDLHTGRSSTLARSSNSTRLNSPTLSIPGEESDDDTDNFLPEDSVRALADVASSHLERVLASFVAYVPQAEKSSQNRYKPIGWEMVLKVASAAGLADDQVVKSLQDRLERIYPRSSHPYVDRIAYSASHCVKTADALDAYDLDILTIPGAEGPRKRDAPSLHFLLHKPLVLILS
ncbi:hypothetical protein OF83DRAFT_75309 [Amylostereum chailletii]|nr:hypothetical protein OF83DRAFT_75309 [Amylostereum chailletii]